MDTGAIPQVMNIIQEQFHVLGLGAFAAIFLNRPLQVAKPRATLVSEAVRHACVLIGTQEERDIKYASQCVHVSEHSSLHSVN